MKSITMRLIDIINYKEEDTTIAKIGLDFRLTRLSIREGVIFEQINSEDVLIILKVENVEISEENIEITSGQNIKYCFKLV